MTVAYIALFGWPIVSLLFFKRFSVPVAVMATLIFGFLLLPTQVGVNLPVLPTLQKNTIPALSALFFALVVFAAPKGSLAQAKDRISAAAQNKFLPSSLTAKLCLAAFIVGAILTSLTNSDPLFYGGIRLPGMRVYDALSAILSMLMIWMPFFLGHKFMASPERHRSLLKVLVIAGLGYTLLAAFELRMSPQLNNMVYGFFPHSFAQHVRAGGYRPLVFMTHGLVLAVFFAMIVLAAIGMFRSAEGGGKVKYLAAAGWVALIVALSNSLGALILVVLFAPLALLLRPRTQLLIAAIVGIIVLSYPVLRGAGLVPVNTILSYAERIDPARAASLNVRINNEERLIEKAMQRPAFGWGGYGRSRVFSEEGRDISTTDGAWVLALGLGGWTRYLTLFGLLCLPMAFLLLAYKRLNIGMETSILALMLALNLVDQLPNSSRMPVTWMIAGALWGRLSLGRIEQVVPAENEEHPTGPPPKRKSPYARPHPGHEPISVRYTAQTTVHTPYSRSPHSNS